MDLLEEGRLGTLGLQALVGHLAPSFSAAPCTTSVPGAALCASPVIPCSATCNDGATDGTGG